MVYISLTFVIKFFTDTIEKIRKNELNESNLDELKEDLKNWLGQYVELVPRNTKEITPYIHIFAFHLPEFILKHKNINIYNLQGLEKLNDFVTQIYHCSSNKHKLKSSRANRKHSFDQTRITYVLRMLLSVHHKQVLPRRNANAAIAPPVSPPPYHQRTRDKH